MRRWNGDSGSEVPRSQFGLRGRTTRSTRRFWARPSAIIAGHGVKLGVAGGRDPIRRHGLHGRERSARCGWRGPSRVPSWSRIRRCGWECCRCGLRCADRKGCGRVKPRSGAAWESLRLGRGRSGGEEAGLAQADDQAVAAHLDGDRVRGDLVGKSLLELAADVVKIVFDPGRRQHILAHHDVHGHDRLSVPAGWAGGGWIEGRREASGKMPRERKAESIDARPAPVSSGRLWRRRRGQQRSRRAG
jgi:hypothetical protein